MDESIQRIRDFINKPRRQYLLLKNPALWSQCCSCLDVIEDSELAIVSYSAGEFGPSVGAHYLAVYGLLQALFLQQDAIDNLCKSLKIPDTIYKYPRLKQIREIRNMSIGHPTKRKRKGNSKKGELPSYHFISRPTLSINGFTLVSDYADGTSEPEDISVPDLIADQKEYVSGIINTVKDNLGKKEAPHKEKFRMEKLAATFPDTLNYFLGKILETTTGIQEDVIPAVASLQQVKQAIQSFRQALEKRGIELETYDSIKRVYDSLEYPLSELEKFFQSVKSGSQPNIDEKTAYIFAFFVGKQVAELRQTAQEIDEDYSR